MTEFAVKYSADDALRAKTSINRFLDHMDEVSKFVHPMLKTINELTSEEAQIRALRNGNWESPASLGPKRPCFSMLDIPCPSSVSDV